MREAAKERTGNMKTGSPVGDRDGKGAVPALPCAVPMSSRAASAPFRAARILPRVALILVLAAGLLTGCGSGSASAPVTPGSGETRPATPPAEDPAPYTSTLPDYSGEGFVIVSAAGEWLTEPEIPETVWSAKRTSRLLAAAGESGVAVGESALSADDIYRRLSDAALAETDFADLLLLPASQVGRFAAAGLLQDLSALPFFSLDGEGIDAAGVDAFTIYKKTWALTGGALFDPAGLGCVSFDISAAEAAGLDLFAVAGVSDGESGWSTDDFAAAAAALGAFACPAGEEETVSGFFCASGMPTMTASRDADPVLIAPTDAELALTDALHTLLFGEASLCLGFETETAPLLVTDLSAALLPDTGASRRGILPMPSDQTGGTPVLKNVCVAAVPAACRYPEKTALILSALTASGADAEEDFLRWCLDHCVSNYEQLRGISAVLSAPRIWDPASYLTQTVGQLDTVTLKARLNSVKMGLHSRLSAWDSYAETAAENLRQRLEG